MEEKIVVHSSYYNPIEASIIKARLDDSDIPCFLSDENVATINPLYNQAIGGVRLHVFERDLERVNLLLAEQVDMGVPIVKEEEASAITCESCGSTNVGYGQATQKRFSIWVLLVSLFFKSYPFKANSCYHCYDCGHEFK